MSGATVRVKPETHLALRELAEQGHESMQDVLARAVEMYRRHRILEETNAAYAALRADPEQWQEVLDERAEWESTLLDDLENDAS
jgi:succinate dehydrogenase/fumarate reductase flavoprotein subunit